nr:hypothetical protein [Hyphomonas sp. Mor2]
MLGVLMLLSFLIPLIGALAIRRYAWVAAWAGVSAIVAVPVLYKLMSRTYDPMGWGFVFVLVFLPAALGSGLGMAITALRRRLQGPGEIEVINKILAGAFAVSTISLGLILAGDA